MAAASIVLGYRVLRGTAAGPEYLSEFATIAGDVMDQFEWTGDREASILFGCRDDASDIRDLAVVRERRCAAVVPASANDRAMAELNRIAEW